MLNSRFFGRTIRMFFVTLAFTQVLWSKTSPSSPPAPVKEYTFEDGLKKLYMHRFKDAVGIFKSHAKKSKYFHSYYSTLHIQKYVYLEDWDKLISLPSPSPKLEPIGLLMNYLGKGMAFAAKHKTVEAIQQLKLINSLAKSPSLKASPLSLAEVEFSTNFLMGYIRMQERKYKASARQFKAAHKKELELPVYNPFSWVFNSMYYLGVVYEILDQKIKAIQIYETLLDRLPQYPKARQNLNTLQSKK